METNIELGQLLGRRQAFNLIAGRCTAADASGLRQMRQDRVWEGHARGWREFCALHLHLSGSQVNRIIQALEEFGAAYFDVAQLTRISPEIYRIIAPAIREHAIHVDGEPIALIQENAALVAAAVDRLRKSARPTPKPVQNAVPTVAERVAALDLRCTEVVEEFTALARTSSRQSHLSDMLCRFLTRLERLEKEFA